MIDKQEFIYPIIFSSIPVQKVWGGHFINDYLKQYNQNVISLTDNNTHFGELWLVTDRKKEMSVVSNGILKGLTLNELWNEHNEEIFGRVKLQRSKKVFPLLIKIIDAGDDLSLQVHPSEKDLKILPKAEAKTEMWFVIDAKPNANILAGIKNNTIDKGSFFKMVNEHADLKKVINNFQSSQYKYYYIPSGTIHAIGKGNLIFEIQQNSDTTYRVSDWGRKDINGNSRDLHIEESKVCIDFAQKTLFNGSINLEKEIIEQKISPDNPYFNLYFWHINSKCKVNTFDTYKILTVVSGSLKINFKNKDYNLSKFSTALLPIGNEYDITNISDKTVFLSYHT